MSQLAELMATDIRASWALNCVAPAELTRQVLPGMLERRRGRILNVASTAAFQPGPLMAVYYATKAFVLSLSEALHHELKGTGVTVTAVHPVAPVADREHRWREELGLIQAVLAMRERIRPYLDAQMVLAHEQGIPPIRPLFVDFPDDPRSWAVEDEFLLGPDVLVAPILDSGARGPSLH